MLCISTSIAAALAVAAQATPAPHGWTFSGFGDAYVGAATPNPGNGPTRAARLYDNRNGQARLAAFAVTAKYTDPKSGLGATITPFVGDDADILFMTDSATKNWLGHYVSEAYGSYTFKDGTEIDAGKFLTFVGYTGFNASGNDIYSAPILGTLAQPSFHTGVRASRQLTDKLGGSLFITNGWNSTERKTQGLSYGAQLRYDMGKGQALTGSVLSGREGAWNDTNNGGGYGGINFLQPGVSDVTTVDVDYVKNFTATTHVAVDALYTTSKGIPNNGTFYGFYVSGLKDLGRGYGLALRLESFSDAGGILLGAPTTIQSAVLEGRYQINPTNMVRLELRADKANRLIYNDTSGGVTDHQTTLNLAYFVSF